MFSLDGKNILVTGASSGIGKQIAINVAEFGATVTLIGRNTTRLNEVKDQLIGSGHTCFSFDLTDQIEMDKFIKQCPKFDGVVFNAGIIDYGPVKFINEAKVNLIFDTNFKAAVLLSQQLIKHKLINKMGSLVFISSISSKIGVAGTALYAASKAALSAYAKVVASELAIQKIRSNCICPGIVITPMTNQAIDMSSADAVNDAEKAYPLGYGKPEDVSGLALYLLSDASKWMTGSDLVIDGGLTIT